MTTKKRMQILIDLAMTIILPMLMAYSLVGEVAHEWLGVAMFVFFIAHQFMNRGWYKALFKGRYAFRRITHTVIDGLLFIDMIALMVSGMIMSRHVFAALPLQGGMAFARTTHFLAAFWGFLLMSVHIGFHINAIKSAMWKFAGSRKPAIRRKVILPTLAIAISAYGGYAFIKRQIGAYMFLKIQFVFFDFSEPLVLFYMDYLAIMVLFASAGHIFFRLTQENSLKAGGKKEI